MNEGKWVTINGHHVLIKDKDKDDYMNAKIKSKMKKENIEIKSANTNLLGEEKYIKTINVNGTQVGQLDYHYENETPFIDYLTVHPNYRRRGYATRLMKELQKEIGNKEINFDLLTKDGKELIKKIANITNKREEKHDIWTIGTPGNPSRYKGETKTTHYKGKIKM